MKLLQLVLASHLSEPLRDKRFDLVADMSALFEGIGISNQRFLSPLRTYERDAEARRKF